MALVSKNTFSHRDVFNPLSTAPLSPYSKFALALPRKNCKIKAILSLLPQFELAPQSIGIDIGTGHGALAEFFSKHGKWEFVDQEGAGFSIAKNLISGEFHVGDGLQYLRAKQPNSVDLVTCFDVDFYFPDPIELYVAVFNVLAPGGKFVISGMEIRPKHWLVRLRSLLGVEQAVDAVANFDAETKALHLRKVGFSNLTTHWYYGSNSLLGQTLIDYLGLKLRRQPNGTLTLNPKQDKLPSTAVISILSLFTKIVGFLDSLFCRKTRHAFIILADKP